MKLLGRELTLEELCMGGAVAFVFISILKWWIVIAIPVCALLWAYGGAEETSKAWRRIGVPLVLAVLLALITKSPWVLASALPAWGVLTLGYGLPDEKSGDEGSMLGRFWYDKIDDLFLADVMVRTTIGFLFGLSFFTLAFAGHPVAWILSTLALGILMPLIEEGVE